MGSDFFNGCEPCRFQEGARMLWYWRPWPGSGGDEHEGLGCCKCFEDLFLIWALIHFFCVGCCSWEDAASKGEGGF